MIQGYRYTINDLDKLPLELDPAKLETCKVGEMLEYFGGQCLLSNFQMSDFDVDDVMYNFNEKLYVKQTRRIW